MLQREVTAFVGIREMVVFSVIYDANEVELFCGGRMSGERPSAGEDVLSEFEIMDVSLTVEGTSRE